MVVHYRRQSTNRVHQDCSWIGGSLCWLCSSWCRQQEQGVHWCFSNWVGRSTSCTFRERHVWRCTDGCMIDCVTTDARSWRQWLQGIRDHRSSLCGFTLALFHPSLRCYCGMALPLSKFREIDSSFEMLTWNSIELFYIYSTVSILYSFLSSSSLHTNLLPYCHAVATRNNKNNLFGKSDEEKTQVLQWASWANTNLLGALAAWWVHISTWYI